MPKFDIMFARFPFLNAEAPSVTNWMIKNVLWCSKSPLIGEIHHREYDDTPITMTRNQAMKEAKHLEADFLVMIDSDMWPDVGEAGDYHIPGHKPFLPNAIDFALNHAGPCVVGAPYCGPPPHENVYIFRPATYQTNNPNFDFRIEMLGREDAAQRSGFEEVAALPTGCMLIDMRCVKNLRHPYFDYEHDEEWTKKESTEDVYFSRNLMLAGVPQYVYWQAWAGHHKRKVVTKPRLLTTDEICKQYKDAIMRGQVSNEKLVMVGEAQKKDGFAHQFKDQEYANKVREMLEKTMAKDLEANLAARKSASGDEFVAMMRRNAAEASLRPTPSAWLADLAARRDKAMDDFTDSGLAAVEAAISSNGSTPTEQDHDVHEDGF